MKLKDLLNKEDVELSEEQGNNTLTEVQLDLFPIRGIVVLKCDIGDNRFIPASWEHDLTDKQACSILKVIYNSREEKVIEIITNGFFHIFSDDWVCDSITDIVNKLPIDETEPITMSELEQLPITAELKEQLFEEIMNRSSK